MELEMFANVVLSDFCYLFTLTVLALMLNILLFEKRKQLSVQTMDCKLIKKNFVALKNVDIDPSTTAKKTVKGSFK